MRLNCHAGLRAPRYVRNAADLAANPSLFRCDSCGALLPAPEWQPTLEVFEYYCGNCCRHWADAQCDLCGAALSLRGGQTVAQSSGRPGLSPVVSGPTGCPRPLHSETTGGASQEARDGAANAVSPLRMGVSQSFGRHSDIPPRVGGRISATRKGGF